jgi:hypothetical protein
VNINLAALRELRCRYGCAQPIGIFHLPYGSQDHPDPIQALCEQHARYVITPSVMQCLVDLRLRRKH